MKRHIRDSSICNTWTLHGSWWRHLKKILFVRTSGKFEHWQDIQYKGVSAIFKMWWWISWWFFSKSIYFRDISWVIYWWNDTICDIYFRCNPCAVGLSGGCEWSEIGHYEGRETGMWWFTIQLSLLLCMFEMCHNKCFKKKSLLVHSHSKMPWSQGNECVWPVDPASETRPRYVSTGDEPSAERAMCIICCLR